ncbi:MAG: glycosyltransferase family 4 protein [Acidilobus sp.]
MESLRIALVSDWFLPRVGGVEVSIDELAAELSREGHETFVVTSTGLHSDGSGPLENRNGFTVYRVPSRIHGLDGVTADPFAVVRALLFVKWNAFDIVHSHGISSTLSLFSSMIASGGTGVPSVLTNHSLLDDGIQPPVRWLLRYALKWPRVITGVSNAAARDVERISGRRAFVTPNCINVRAWRENVRPIELGGEPAIVITSRLSKRKNPLEIAMVAEELMKRLPRARLYVIGSGSEGALLKSRLNDKGLGSVVELLGLRPRDEIAGLLASADFFVLTSRRESFGVAILESMALGTVPVIYKSPGALDLVADGVNGFVVDGPKRLVDKIVEVHENRDLYAKLSSKAASTAEKFDCSRVIREFVMPLYRLALDKCEEGDERFLVYRAYRQIVGDPVRRGEWCRERKWLYHEHAREGLVPVVRRRA